MLPISNLNPIEEPIKIFPISYSFPILSLITLSLSYAKLTVYFYVEWMVILSPMILFFGVQGLMCLYSIRSLIKNDTTNLTTLWAVVSVFLNGSLAVSFWLLGDLISEQENELVQEKLTILFMMIAFVLLVYMGYVIAASSLQKQSGWGTSNIITNLLLSLMGNSFSICAGGACNSFYISTFSAFFSAFGISITKYIHYLNYVCVFLLGFSLFSLYSVKRSFKYGPFLSTLIGATMIILDMFVYDMDVLNYVGNGVIIASACWNSRINKYRFGGRKNT